MSEPFMNDSTKALERLALYWIDDMPTAWRDVESLYQATDTLARVTEGCLVSHIDQAPRLLSGAGHWLRVMGRPPDLELLRRAAALAEQYDDMPTLADVYWGLGWQAVAVGDLSEAGIQFERSMDLYARVCDADGLNEAALGNATVLRLKDDQSSRTKAIDTLTRIARQSKSSRNRRRYADAMWGLAMIALEEGDRVAAIARLSSATKNSRHAIRGRCMRGDLVDSFASYADEELDPETSRMPVQVEKLIDLLGTVETGRIELAGVIESSIARVLAPLQALQSPMAGELIDKIRGIGDQMGGSTHSLGGISRSIQPMIAAYELYEPVGDPRRQAVAASRIASEALTGGRHRAANTAYGVVVHLCKKSGDPRWHAVGISGQASIALDRGELEKAETSYQQALELTPEADKRTRAGIFRRLGLVAERRRDVSYAATWYRQAQALYEEIGDGGAAHECERTVQRL